MRRRELLASIGACGVTAGATAWFVGGNYSDEQPEQSATPVPEYPNHAQRLEPLMVETHQHMNQFYDTARIFGGRDGVTMLYETEASTPDELEIELHQIVVEFALLLKRSEFPRVSFTVITDEVQAIAVKPALRAFCESRLNRESLLKTVEVTDVERRD